MDIFFPHIRYISDNDIQEKHLVYLGGEPDENHKRLTVGKSYKLRTSLYAENRTDKRKRVWVCSDDENKGKLCRINLKNFGDKSDLRDRKIEQVLK